MATSEFEILKARLKGVWAYEKKESPSIVIETVRPSGLSSVEVARLLVEVPHVPAGHHAFSACAALREGLQMIYEERTRKETSDAARAQPTESVVSAVTLEQATRWFNILANARMDGPHRSFDAKCRAFVGFARSLAADRSATGLLLRTIGEPVASAAAESVLQAIDLAVDGLDAPARSVGPLFTPPRTELEERVQKLAAYIGWILQVSELASRPSEEIVTRNLQLRRRLSEALSGSTDFEVPGVEAAVVYIFGTFLAGTPPPTFAALPRLTNQIPLQFDLLVQCSEATLNLLRVEQDRAGPTARRRKSEKFGILDSPTLLSSDLAAAKGPLGTACIYLDIDDFKALNTRFTERVVDRDLLPDFQRLLSSMVDAVGFAYAEGGDEYAALLPNSTSKMANAFVEGLQEQLRRRVFEVSGERIELQISVGIAHVEAGGDRDALPELANAAMRAAKAAGKNRTYLHTVEGPQDVGGQPGP